MEYDEYKYKANHCRTFEELDDVYKRFSELTEDDKTKVRETFGDAFGNVYSAYKGMKEKGTLDSYLESRKVVYLFSME